MYTVSNLNLFMKRMVDLIVSIIGLILLFPLMVLVSFLISITMPGPIFFKQERVGKNKKVFNILKFRTMKVDKEAEKTLDFSKDEVRLTKIGKILRRTKIDEVPQLINVLKGDMSLVGPRPTVMIQVKEYTPLQLNRLNVKPGMTGLAQVNGNISLSWEQRIGYDLHYIQHYSILLDLKILIKTVGIIVFGEEKFKKEKMITYNSLNPAILKPKETNMKTILIGSVNSSKVVLEEMIKLNFPIDMVYSLDEKYSYNVSGYEPIHKIAEENNIPYRKFRKINEETIINEIKEMNPDYIFVIGLSQLINSEIIDAAKVGAIGFHPTPLPRYRGRAAIVWQILLGVKETESTLFFIDDGMDSGNIIAQEEYIIDDSDYAIDVLSKCDEALKRMINRVLPQLLEGTINSIKQNEEEATYLLKRTPEDGKIDWNESVESIQRLIRAVSKPYPGAFSNYQANHKVIFWKAHYFENEKYIGIPGQIAQITDEFLDIVCVDGILRVYEYENINQVKLTVGNKFK